MSLRDTPEGAAIIVERLKRFGILRSVERIAKIYCVTAQDIVGRCRSTNIVAARHHAWAVIRWTLVMSYPEIGALFDVDYSSVMHGVRKYERSISKEAA